LHLSFTFLCSTVGYTDTENDRIQNKNKKIAARPDLEAALKPHLPLGCPQEEALRVAQLLLAHQTQRRQA